MRSLLSSQDSRIEAESPFLMNSHWLPVVYRRKCSKGSTKWTFGCVVQDLDYILLKKKKREILNTEVVRVTSVPSCIFLKALLMKDDSHILKFTPACIFKTSRELSLVVFEKEQVLLCIF